MEGGGRQSRLLARLIGRLRGDHHKYPLDKRFSLTSTSISEGCGSTNEEDDPDLIEAAPMALLQQTQSTETNSKIDDTQLAANIDMRYGGQYLSAEQLPEFCDQLHHLVQVIRNIESYAKITGEYPRSLERRLEREARAVAALAAEARNALDVAERAKAQRRALRSYRDHLTSHLAVLRDSEIRELESTVRLSDRKLYKSWEAHKDSNELSVFEPIVEEIMNKQTALDCLLRLINNRRSNVARSAPPPPPSLLLPLPSLNDDEDCLDSTTSASVGRRRHEGVRRTGCKRRRKESGREPRSVPLSGETSRLGPPSQATESSSRYRVGSTGAVTITPIDLPSGGSVRDILFFTAI